MTPAEIWEEIICDSLGEMNIFASAEKTTEQTGQTEVSEQATTAQPETAQNRGPPTGKMSRETSKEETEHGRAGEMEGRSDPVNEGRTGEAGEYDARGAGSRKASYERKIKEVLHRMGKILPGGGKDGSARVETRESLLDFEDRTRGEGMAYYESPSGRTAAAYAEAYEGSRMTPEEIWEEIICDSLADMNIFAEQENAETAPEVLEETKKASTGVEAEQSRGPPEGKMSRETEKEVSRYGRAREEGIRDNTVNEGSTREAGQYGSQRAGSQTGRYAGKIKEILLQSVQSGNNGGIEGHKTQRVIQRETSEAFESRIHNDGMFYYEGAGGALAFTPATRQNENATAAQKYLEDLGIDVIVFEGELQANRGSTSRSKTPKKHKPCPAGRRGPRRWFDCAIRR